MTKPKPSIRVRLTLLYTGLFAAGGAVLVVITYALMATLSVDPSSVRLPNGEMSGIQIPDWRNFEPVCRRALDNPDADSNLTAKCAVAYQIWGAQRQREATLSHLLQYSLITLAVVTVLAAFTGWIVAGRALRPVHRITAAARAAADNDLSARVALTGPRDELRELADTFDDMLGRLQATFDSQGRFIANASHELRTPLSFMRATVDVVLAKPAPTDAELRSMAQDVRIAVDDAEQLVGALLTLARNERGLTVREDVDLATVAEDVLDSVDPLDRRTYGSLEPAVTSGDPVLLERLIANLVDNAVRYNVPSGDVWVTTSTVDGLPTVVVANTGAQIPPGSVDGLFEPFHRLSDRTTGDGFGLGLAIVASIAAMHHGRVSAHPRPGGGLRVVLTMPPATQPRPDQTDGSTAAVPVARHHSYRRMPVTTR